MEIPKMLTINEASAQANITPCTVRRLCAEKKVITIRTGNKWLINADSLARYLSGVDNKEE